MSLELLDKTRKINRLLTEQETDKVNFNDFCKVLSGALEVNVLLVSRKGKVLGMKEKRNIDVIPQLKDTKYGCYIDSAVQERFMNILSTKENVNLLTIGLEWENVKICQAMVSPVIISGKRLGTLLVYRYDAPFP